jgi:hypothetical protein
VSHRAERESWQRPLSSSGPPRQLGRPISLSTVTVKTAASRAIRRRNAERVLKNINAGHLACAALGGCDSSEVESVASAMGVTITGFNDEAEEAEGDDPTFNVEPGWSSIPGWMSHQPGCDRWRDRPTASSTYQDLDQTDPTGQRRPIAKIRSIWCLSSPTTITSSAQSGKSDAISGCPRVGATVRKWGHVAECHNPALASRSVARSMAQRAARARTCRALTARMHGEKIAFSSRAQVKH